MKGLLLAVSASMFFSLPATAQIPTRFENLKVLPKDISRDSLVATMRYITGALGTRCGFCHVGGDTATLVGVEFKSDSLVSKRRARDMMRMVADINTRLATTETPKSADIAVECLTCHRGLTRPEPLHALLMRTISKEGVEAAIAQYRSLRGQVLDRGRYDFGEASLNMLARQLRSQIRDAEAIRMLELNKEFHPDAPTLNFDLAELYLKIGDRERALALYRLVLEKQPQNAAARNRIQQLTRG
jgi:hypothetical protein